MVNQAAQYNHNNRSKPVNGLNNLWWVLQWLPHQWRCNPVRWLTGPWCPWRGWQHRLMATSPWMYERLFTFSHAFLRYLTFFHLLFNSQQWLQESGRKWWLVQCPVDHLRWDLWRSRLCPFVLLQINNWIHSVPSKPKTNKWSLKRKASGQTTQDIPHTYIHTYTLYMHHVFEDEKIWFVFLFWSQCICTAAIVTSRLFRWSIHLSIFFFFFHTDP